jgi:RNA polymerase sigma-70 factor (TIGR02943 family)
VLREDISWLIHIHARSGCFLLTRLGESAIIEASEFTILVGFRHLQTPIRGKGCNAASIDQRMDELIQTKNTSLNPSAWVGQYGDCLYRYAMSRLRDSEAAEEVVQETFVAGLRHVEQYSGKGSERGWLMGILKRKIIDLVRSRSRASSLTNDDGSDPSEALFDQSGRWRAEIRSAGYQPLDSLEREEFWKILRTCMDTLPARHADVFTLREMEDESTEEICKELEITPSNLWVILYRARLQLANCMKTRWQQSHS